MTHINHFRSISYLNSLSAEAVVNLSSESSFSIFCGTDFKRNELSLYEMNKFYGKIGIVYLYNDPRNMAPLTRLASLSGRENVRMYLTYDRGQSYYDPFYGLNQSFVLDAMFSGATSMSVSEIEENRSIINDYLDILNYQFSKGSLTYFGKYPYNLDMLMTLAEMSYPTLFESVISFLPFELKERLRRSLSDDKAQQKAYNAVRSFSQQVGSHFWTRRQFRNHSRLSIISTVRNRDLISIYVPASRKNILDYLSIELQQLVADNVPFLIVTNGIKLIDSEKLKDIFLADHRTQHYYCGIVSDTASNVVKTNDPDDMAKLFGQSENMYVLNCPDAGTAQPFSQGVGVYYRMVREHHNDKHREPFHFFSSHSWGNAQRETVQNIVTPEELMHLGNGCLLCGSNRFDPCIIKDLK